MGKLIPLSLKAPSAFKLEKEIKMPAANSRGFARSIQARQRMVHEIHVSLDGTGTAALLSGSREVSLTDSGTGDYLLTFVTKPRRVLAVHATSLTADSVVNVGAVSTTSVQLLATDLAAAAKDVDMYVTLVVSDSADEI